MRTVLKKNRINSSVIYVLPMILGLLFFKFYPMLQVFFTSFKENFSYLTSEYNSLGFENYSYIMQDEHFVQSIFNGIAYAFLSTILCFTISLPTAWGLYRVKENFSKFFQFMICLPFVTSDIVMGGVWRLLFSDAGWINGFLDCFKVGPVSWLTGGGWPFVSLVMFSAWNAFPLSVLIIYCSFLNLDSNIILAAEINGATSWKILIRLVMPMTRPALNTVIILNLTNFWLEINVFFPLFMGEPGPFNDLYLPVYYIYEQMHQGKSFAYACAGSVILFVCIILTIVVPAGIKKLVKK